MVSGLYEVLVNRRGGELMQKNLELLGPVKYTEKEIFFGKKIQEETGKPQLGMDSEIKPLEESSKPIPFLKMQQPKPNRLKSSIKTQAAKTALPKKK